MTELTEEDVRVLMNLAQRLQNMRNGQAQRLQEARAIDRPWARWRAWSMRTMQEAREKAGLISVFDRHSPVDKFRRELRRMRRGARPE